MEKGQGKKADTLQTDNVFTRNEYIEREAVNALIKAECSPKVAAYLIDAVATVPAADVVPVVRCKDCKDGKEARVNEKGFLICPASGMEITDNDYCSYGVSKDGDGE